jgi:hypothetical protein
MPSKLTLDNRLASTCLDKPLVDTPPPGRSKVWP